MRTCSTADFRTASLQSASSCSGEVSGAAMVSASVRSEDSAAPPGTDESIDTLRSDARAISLRWDMCTSLTIIVAR